MNQLALTTEFDKESSTIIPIAADVNDVRVYFEHVISQTDEGRALTERARFLERRASNYNYASIISKIHAFDDEHGHSPSKESGRLHPNAENSLTWKDVDIILLFGLGECNGGESLDHLLIETGYKLNKHKSPNLSEALILYNGLKYFLSSNHETPEKRKFPNQNSGKIIGLPKENWGTWQVALNSGRRNLSRGLTLDKLFIKYGLRFGDLTESLIVRHTLKHYQRFGSLPGSKDGHLFDVIGENWTNIESALRSGRRGLPGESSLQGLYTQHGLIPPALNKQNLGQLILNHIRLDTHHTFPTENSGTIYGYLAKTWHAVDRELYKGNIADIPQKTTLPQFIEILVREQATKYRTRYGSLPTRDSAMPLPDYPEVSWRVIDEAFRNKRGGYQTNLETVLNSEQTALTIALTL